MATPRTNRHDSLILRNRDDDPPFDTSKAPAGIADDVSSKCHAVRHPRALGRGIAMRHATRYGGGDSVRVKCDDADSAVSP